MDSNFDLALNFTLRQEGGYVNDPRDPGGETNGGITKKTYPSLNIATLTPEDKEKIYFEDYWEACRCDEMPFNLALSVFDMAVHSGAPAAIRTLQKTLDVDIDGIIGAQTLSAIKNDSYIQFNSERLIYMNRLIGNDVYIKGWCTRVLMLIQYLTENKYESQ